MKRKGFTLIELLAVIVILAIIALIATPIVMNVIENSRKGAAERSTENYLSAVETAIATKRLEDSTNANGEYIVNSEGNLCQIGGDCLTVEVSGDRPRNGSTVVINEGIIVKESTNIIVNNYDVKYNTESEKFEASDYNPYGYGTKYVLDPGDGIERIFYVLEYKGTTNLTTGSTVSDEKEVALIMNEAISSTKTAWINETTYLEAGGTEEDWTNQKYNILGPLKANQFLANQTGEWDIGEVSLPTGYQIGQASGISDWDNDSQKDNIPSWLGYNSDLGGGYWTSTRIKYGNKSAFFVYSTQGYMAHSDVYPNNNLVRPVITISKDLLR